MKIKETDHILVSMLKKLHTEKHSHERLFMVFLLLEAQLIVYYIYL